MADPENHDLAPVIVYPIDEAVGAAADAPQSVQLVAQRYPQPPRIVQQGPGYQLDDGCGHGLREFFRDGPGCGPRDDDLITGPLPSRPECPDSVDAAHHIALGVRALRLGEFPESVAVADDRQRLLKRLEVLRAHEDRCR